MYDDESGDKNRAPANPRMMERERAGQPVDYYRLIRVLRNGRKSLLILAVVSTLVGLLVAKFVMPRAWKSHAVLVYEGVITKNADGEDTVVADPRELRTMVDSVKIPANLQKVQKQLGLKGPLDLFARRVDVTFDLESNLVEIWGTGAKADDAVELANTMVEVFLEHRRSVDQERLRDLVDNIDKNLRMAEKNEKAARDRFDAFRQVKGIADLTTERLRSIQTAADLQAKADLAGARAKELEAKIGAADPGGTAPTPAPSPGTGATQADREELARAKAELSSALSRYTDEHPLVQSLKSRVSQLEAKVGTGGTGASRWRADRDAALREEASYRSQADHARGVVAKFSDAEGEATNLLAAVEVAAARVKSLRQDLGKAEAKARTPTTGFRTESAASRPDNPERSTARMATAIAIPAISLLILLGFLLWKELGNLKVCTPAEVAYWGKGPVIGSTAWPRQPQALNDLIAEMDDYMVDASGSTLVVPATERELDLVKTISERFSQEDWHPEQVFVTSVEVLPPPITVRDGSSSAPPPSKSTALAPTSGAGALIREADAAFALKAEAWTGPDAGPALRRAARRADRVLVIVRASQTTAMELSQVPGRLGREDGIGYLVVGLEDEFSKLPDRAGRISGFWRTYRDRS